MSGKIAIIGAGPSGCYLAQALLKANPDLEVDLIDSLPVPYGLVRYGVAADHQGTKAVARQFARVFERQGAQFFGNVHVERDVTLDALRTAYDTVVLAAGLSADRKLGIANDDLPGVYGAGRLTRALFEYPDAEALPELGPKPLIIGNGNVAIDLLRLLAKAPDELEGSDLGPGPTAWLANSGIDTLTIIGRSPAAQAKFDPVMIKELAKLANVKIEVVDLGESLNPDEQKNLDALAAINGHGTGPRRIVFRFGLLPVSVEGAERAEVVRFVGERGDEAISCSSVMTAIGFESAGDLPRDLLISQALDAENGLLAQGLYAVGWFRRGPRGTIPQNRADAQDLAKRILAELSDDPNRPGRAVLAGFDAATSYQGWLQIDAAETRAAPADRCRTKISTKGEMLRIAAREEVS